MGIHDGTRTRQRIPLKSIYPSGQPLTVKDCHKCGIVFGMPESFDNRKYETGESWFCPNGHEAVYTTSEATKQRERAEQVERELTRARQALDEEAREHRTTEASRRTLLKRARNGICPHCNRSFYKLARHVQTKHPDAEPLIQPAVHKRRFRSERRTDRKRATSCWRSVNFERTAYRWADVSCKDCLRHH